LAQATHRKRARAADIDAAKERDEGGHLDLSPDRGGFPTIHGAAARRKNNTKARLLRMLRERHPIQGGS
jgi:hypothetical protein